jgi:type IV secretion system protein VirB1
MMGCPNLAVPATVMRHVVDVESGANPYAIGVVGGRLARQPKSLDEAVATARMLEAKGYNFSLGIAQVNRANLGKHGLDTHEKAFDPCSNLLAGSRILADCHTSAGGDWGKAFSCYYSGNFVTGFEHGYVQKIYDSISRGSTVAGTGTTAAAIPRRQAARSAVSSSIGAKGNTTARATSAPDRIAMRSMTTDHEPSMPIAPDTTTAGPVTSAGVGGGSNIFVPQVRGPGDSRATSTTPAGRTGQRKGGQDGAFVF